MLSFPHGQGKQKASAGKQDNMTARSAVCLVHHGHVASSVLTLYRHHPAAVFLHLHPWHCPATVVLLCCPPLIHMKTPPASLEIPQLQQSACNIHTNSRSKPQTLDHFHGMRLLSRLLDPCRRYSASGWFPNRLRSKLLSQKTRRPAFHFFVPSWERGNARNRIIGAKNLLSIPLCSLRGPTVHLDSSRLPK